MRSLRFAALPLLALAASARAAEPPGAASLRAEALSRKVEIDVERDGGRFACVVAPEQRDVLAVHATNPSGVRYSSSRLQLEARRDEPPDCPVLAPPPDVEVAEPSHGLARVDAHATLPAPVEKNGRFAPDAPRRALAPDGVLDFGVELTLAEPGRYAVVAEVALGGGSDGKPRTLRAPEPVVFARPSGEGLAGFVARASHRVDALVDAAAGADRRIVEVARAAPRGVELWFHVAGPLAKLLKRTEPAGGDRYRVCAGRDARAGLVTPPCATAEQTHEVRIVAAPAGERSLDEIYVRDGAALLARQGATSLYATDGATVKKLAGSIAR